MPEFKKDESEIGAAWIKSGAKGDYLTGMVNGQPFVMFRNDRKAPGSKAPDWRMFRPKPKADPAHVADEDFL